MFHKKDKPLNTDHQLPDSVVSLRQALQNSQALWWVYDLRSGQCFFCEKTAEILGLDPVKINDTGMLKKIMPREDFELMQDNIGLLMRGECPLYETELRLKDRQGNIRWFCMKGNFTEKTEDGIPVKLAGIAFEISNRKNLEANLNFIKDKFDHILKNTSNPILFCECANAVPERIIECNDAACRMFNLSAAELLRTAPAAILNSGINENSVNNIYKKLELQGNVVYRLDKAYGSQTAGTIEVSSQLFEDTGRRQILLSVIREIPRLSSEKSEKDTESKYKKLAENLPVIVYRYCVLPAKKFEYINSAAETITGYSPAEYMHDPDMWEKVIHPEDKAKLKKIRVASHCNCVTSKFRWIRKDGKLIWMEHHDTQHFNKDGKLTLVEGICVDITSRVELEEQTGQNTLAEQMLYRISSSFAQNPDIEKVIPENLEELCRLCGADEAALFSMEADNAFIHQYHWTSRNDSQTQTLFSRTSSKITFPWWREQLKKGILRIDDCSILPDGAEQESFVLNAHNIKRLLAVPLSLSSSLPCFIVLAGPRQDLTESACRTLETAGEMIYSAYIRVAVAGAARASEEKCRAIRRVIPDIIMQISKDGVFIECDATDPDDLPQPAEKVIDKKLEAMFPPWLAKKILDNINIVLVTRETQKFEYALPVKDEIRYFEARLAFLNENEVLCLIRNITAQKTIQTENQDCKDVLDKIYSNIPVGIFIKAMPDFHYDICNEAAAAILNIPKEEILNKTDFDIFPKDVAKLRRQNDIDAIVENQTIDSQEIIIDRAGQRKCLRTIKLPVSRANSKCLLEISEDITDKNKISEELISSEEKYRTLIESSDDRIVLFDLEGNILLANNAFYDTAGYSREDKSIADHFKYIFPSAEKPFRKMIEMLMAETMTSAEYKIPHKSGKELDMLAKFILIKNKGHIPDSVLGIIKDITELKTVHQKLIEARDQAERSDKLKSAFLANMSHEIRTPMNAIVGFANLLADSNATDQERIDYINIINQNSSELLNLISDIVDISKLESGQLETHKVNLSIQQVINQLYAGFSKITNAEIKLLKIIPDGFENASIYTDEARFVQIFSNLLNNSLKFTSKGTIEYGFMPPENNLIKFFVKDTGTGISQEFKNIIFEPFRQVDDSYTRKFRGAGLGLAICMDLVKLLGGNIWFESEVGQGTTFYFTLPKMEAEAAPAPAPAAPAADWVSGNFNWDGRTVLIVDDNEICLRYLEAILHNTGFKLLRAESGVKAVMMCKEDPSIDIVLMDIQMPGMNGMEATAEIKKLRKDLPVIAQTAHALSNDRQHILDAGCDEYIAKPIKKLDLLKIISQFIPPHASV